jgi:lipoyl(octanoyl) transferase
VTASVDAATRPGRLIRLPGLSPYAPTLSRMHELAAARLRDEIPDTVLALEHEPVYTAGSSARRDHLLRTESEIRASGAEVRSADRGGSVTFHGPGQLVVYPILDLAPGGDVVAYLRALEDVVVAACADVGVRASRDPAGTGVWASGRKVCAIGVRVKRARVTMHGFALNCSVDLKWFDAIVPCGIVDRQVASLSTCLGRDVPVAEMEPLVLARLAERFGLDLIPRAAEGAGSAISPPEWHERTIF